MQPVNLWVYLKVEVTTDGGLCGCYWLAKEHAFYGLPPLGYELDYREFTRETVVIDRVLQHPGTGTYRAFQTGWLSMGLGDLALWQQSGWHKIEMSDEDKESDRKNVGGS